MKSRIIYLIKTRKCTSLYILIFFLAITFNPLVTSAQEAVRIRTNGYTAQQQAENQTNWMTHYLTLSGTVAKTVYQINLKYLLQSDSLRMNVKETINKNSLHLAITQKKNTELQSVLSPEQYSKYMGVFANARRPSR